MLEDLYSLFSDDEGYIWNFKFNIDKSEISSKNRDRFEVFSWINYTSSQRKSVNIVLLKRIREKKELIFLFETFFHIEFNKLLFILIILIFMNILTNSFIDAYSSRNVSSLIDKYFASWKKRDIIFNNKYFYLIIWLIEWIFIWGNWLSLLYINLNLFLVIWFNLSIFIDILRFTNMNIWKLSHQKSCDEINQRI